MHLINNKYNYHLRRRVVIILYSILVLFKTQYVFYLTQGRMISEFYFIFIYEQL